MELTKEYFDHAIARLSTKDDLQKAVAPLATSDQVEELARMVSGGFEDVQNRLNVNDKISAFEHKFQRLEEALHIKL